VSTLESAGCSEAYAAKHKEINTRDIINFLLFDLDNPSSVHTCLATARRNARAQRTGITREMWESLNSSWLEFQTIKPEFLRSDALPRILDWIKERSAAYRGALLNTILRNDTYYFSQLGTFLERADNTARILDVKYYVLLPSSNMVGGGVDNVQWEAILRSVSAHRSYRWVYKDSYKSWHVADYLILNRAMPRSLRACYEEIDALLEQLSTLYGDQKPCLETSKSTLALLEHGDIDTIFQSGLHEFLLDFIARNNRVGQEVSEAYSFNS
jgi:uncharacterized alpha-E superfamily protein